MDFLSSCLRKSGTLPLCWYEWCFSGLLPVWSIFHLFNVKTKIIIFIVLIFTYFLDYWSQLCRSGSWVSWPCYDGTWNTTPGPHCSPLSGFLWQQFPAIWKALVPIFLSFVDFSVSTILSRKMSTFFCQYTFFTKSTFLFIHHLFLSCVHFHAVPNMLLLLLFSINSQYYAASQLYD